MDTIEIEQQTHTIWKELVVTGLCRGVMAGDEVAQRLFRECCTAWPESFPGMDDDYDNKVQIMKSVHAALAGIS